MFLAENRFDVQSIKIFTKKIERDPGIELGKLLNDGKVDCYKENKVQIRSREACWTSW